MDDNSSDIFKKLIVPSVYCSLLGELGVNEVERGSTIDVVAGEKDDNGQEFDTVL